MKNEISNVSKNINNHYNNERSIDFVHPIGRASYLNVPQCLTVRMFRSLRFRASQVCDRWPDLAPIGLNVPQCLTVRMGYHTDDTIPTIRHNTEYVYRYISCPYLLSRGFEWNTTSNLTFIQNTTRERVKRGESTLGDVCVCVLCIVYYVTSVLCIGDVCVMCLGQCCPRLNKSYARQLEDLARKRVLDASDNTRFRARSSA